MKGFPELTAIDWIGLVKKSGDEWSTYSRTFYLEEKPEVPQPVREQLPVVLLQALLPSSAPTPMSVMLLWRAVPISALAAAQALWAVPLAVWPPEMALP